MWEKHPDRNTQFFALQVTLKPHRPDAQKVAGGGQSPSLFPTAPALLHGPKHFCFQFTPPATAAHVPWRAVELCTLYHWLCRQPKTLAVLRPRCQGCADGIIKAFRPWLGSLGMAWRVPRLWG